VCVCVFVCVVSRSQRIPCTCSRQNDLDFLKNLYYYFRMSTEAADIAVVEVRTR